MAINSLLRQAEIPRAVEILAFLEAVGVDALILQDLGIYYLARRHFPSFRLHASTLTAAHNSLAVKHFADMGFKRVVLPRELSLEEIETIHRKTRVELEVFVHGAMCFSYSGLCLFSSFLGGKSGLRGHCVQPCRRKYKWQSKGKGGREGYFFSMNDLSAIELIDALRRAGVSSFKIEGRMRSVNYVECVTRAYRKVIDTPNDAGVLAEAKELLGEAMGRKMSSGYFESRTPGKLISPSHSGNIGLFVGKISKTEKNMAEFPSRISLKTGDRLRIHHEKTGERQGYTLKKLLVNRQEQQEISSGKLIVVNVPKGAQPGDSIYKVDMGGRRQSANTPAFVPEKPVKNLQGAIRKKTQKVKAALAEASSGEKPSGYKGHKGRRQSPSRKGKEDSLPWRLKTDDPKILNQKLPQSPDRYIFLITPENMKALSRTRINKVTAARVIWALPPLIDEAVLPVYVKFIGQLRRQGFREFQVAHVSQVELFAEEGGNLKTPGKKDRGKPGRAAPVYLSGDYTLNVLNTLALSVLEKTGLSHIQLAIESEREDIHSICANHKGKAVPGFTVYGFPPLFTSRITGPPLRYGSIFASPRDERFSLTGNFGYTLALSDVAFSLLGELKELREMGIGYGVVDFSHEKTTRQSIANVVKQLGGKGKSGRTKSFNYQGSLY
mgnify:CR=1 FL=1